MEAPELYKKYHLDRDDERVGLFKCIVENYDVKNALYPRCFVHIAPSFVIPHVTYVDSYKKAKPFFDNPQVLEYISRRKEYEEDSLLDFIHANYQKKLPLNDESSDLLISQYGGFVSMYYKQYLKKGGLLVANNSHGDASMAHIDKHFELIGVINKQNNKYHLSDKSLEDYFIPKKGNHISKKNCSNSEKVSDMQRLRGIICLRKNSYTRTHSR